MPTICPTAASKKAMGKMMKNPRSKEIAWAGRGRSVEVKYMAITTLHPAKGQAMKYSRSPCSAMLCSMALPSLLNTAAIWGAQASTAP